MPWKALYIYSCLIFVVVAAAFFAIAAAVQTCF